MKSVSNSLKVALPLALAFGAVVPLATADIVGFPIPGWKLNRWDSAPLSPVDPPHSITLTTGTTGQSRSAFYEITQDISEFRADFTYQFSGTQQGFMGAAFVLHNKSLGASIVATGSASGVSTNFGYSDTWGTFGGPSLAVSMQSSYLFSGSSSTGIYTGGSVGWLHEHRLAQLFRATRLTSPFSTTACF